MQNGTQTGADGWSEIANAYGLGGAPAPKAAALTPATADPWEEISAAYGLGSPSAPQASDLTSGPVNRFLVGVGRGMTTLGQSAKEIGLDAAAKAGIIPQASADGYRAQVNDERRLYDSTNPTGAMRAGEIVGEVAPQIPVLGVGGKLVGTLTRGALDAVDGGAALANRLAGAGVPGLRGVALRTVSSAVRGATQGAGTGATSSALTAADHPDQSLTAQVRQGAEIGGALGAAAPAVSAGLGKLKNMLVGAPLDESTALLAQRAGELGVPVSGAQITNSVPMGYLKATLDQIPFTGATARQAAQQEGFNRAIAAQMGADASKITPSVMAATKARLGDQFNAIAARSPIAADEPLLNDLAAVDAGASAEMPESSLKQVRKNLDDVLKAAEDGTIGGEQYQALTRKGTPLDRAMNSGDPNVAHYAGQIRDALDSAIERSANADDVNLLQQTRAQYKAMKTIEPLVERSATGDISPTALLQQVRQHYGSMAYNGGGDMGDLARVGSRFLREPPNSGTAPRNMWTNLLTGGAGVAGGLGIADPAVLGTLATTAGKALLGIPALRGLSAAINSDAYRDLLVNRALDTYPAWQRGVIGARDAIGAAAGRSAIPAAIAARDNLRNRLVGQ